MHGKKLKGEFALVKLKGREENAWLLIKHKDEYAVAKAYDSEKETPAGSPINKWLAKQKDKETEKKSPSEGQRSQNKAEEIYQAHAGERNGYSI